MLTIRHEQLAALQDARRRAFLSALERHVAEEHPETVAAIGAEHVRRRVAEAFERATHHGMTWESTIAAFVGLTFALGPDFDRIPEVHAVLTDPDLDPDARVDALFERTPLLTWLSPGSGA